jgi:RNA polymerase sigma-70 factor (ECF subfamily)
VSAQLRLVRPLPAVDTVEGIGAAEEVLRDLVARKPAAQRRLLATESGRVERILMRILGDARQIEDLTQEVFVRVFARVRDVREPAALRGFVASVAVFVAREAIRKKRRHKWLSFFSSDEVPDVVATDDHEAREALGAIYRVLDSLDPDERVAFALRYIDGMELAEVAAACNCSLATVKRRIDRAGTKFAKLCKKDEVLVRWLEEGDRWA